jgi:hypothetical protein
VVRFGYFIRGSSGPDPTLKVTLDAQRRAMHQRQPPPKTGKLIALPVLGGVQHDYRLAA